MKKACFALGLLSCCGGRSEIDLYGQKHEAPIAEADAGVVVATNSCGGTETLLVHPNQACGTCGLYACDGPNSIICHEAAPNACGDCGPLPAETCNGYDDNCDGVVDEHCNVRLGDPASPYLYVLNVKVSGDYAVMLVTHYAPQIKTRAWLEHISADHGEFLDPDTLTDPNTFDDEGIFIDGNIVAWTRNRGPGQSGETHFRDLTTEEEWTRPGYIADLDDNNIVVVAQTAMPGPRGVEFQYEIRDVRTNELRATTLVDNYDNWYGSVDLEGEWFFKPAGERRAMFPRALNFNTGETIDLPSHEAIWRIVTDGEWVVSMTYAPTADYTMPSPRALWINNLRTEEDRLIESVPHMDSRLALDAGVACWTDASYALQINRLSSGGDITIPHALVAGSNGVWGGCDVSFPNVVYVSETSRVVHLRQLLPGEP